MATQRNKQMKRQTYDRDLEDCEVADGEVVRCPMILQDSMQREVIRHRMQDAAFSEHQALASHRPGYAKDILRWSAYDAALDYGLRDPIAARDAAREERARLGDNLWRTGPALADAVPDDQPDQQMPPGIGGDDDDDDEDSDSDSDNGDDGDSLKRAMAERDQAYSDQYRREPWKDMNGTMYGSRPPQALDPNRASATEAQAERWKAETGKHR
jgi:hypothetical protein